MIKYIATDLDGTLFYPRDRKNMISKTNLFFVQSFIDNGGHLIIVSGRSIEYGKKVMKTIGRNCDIVGYNGGAIYSDGELLKSAYIDKEEVKQIISDLDAMTKFPAIMIMTEDGISVHLRTKSRLVRHIYYYYNYKLGTYSEDFTKTEADYVNDLENKKIYKLMFLVGVSPKKKRMAMEINKAIRFAYPNIESAWSNQVIEITPIGCSKGEAVREFCTKKGIKDDEICVVGDSGNDISMFKEYPQNSFCMEHAPKTIQKYAKYTIDKFEDLSRYLLKK